MKVPSSPSISLLALALALATACAAPPPEPPPATPGLAGSWRAVIASPGGELPFWLEIRDSAGDGTLEAVAVTGPEELPFSAVEQDGDAVVLAMAWYDSEITARRTPDGRLEGRWRRTYPEGDSVLPFTAERRTGNGDGGGNGADGGGDDRRFRPLAEVGLEPGAELASVDGHWRVAFTDEDGTEPARGEFSQRGRRVDGTFLTPTGDYRYLEGSFEDGVLRLSTFDGAHVFLFVAHARADGTLAGDFWSRDNYHATWTAEPIAAADAVLPDAWSEVGLTNDEGRFAFTFPDLDGRPVSLDDPRFAGKVVLVNLFGSWCPNCNDEAPILGRWARAYRDRGLEVVGLAYEFTGDPGRDGEMVRRFAERHELDYTLLLAGISDKAAAAETLPDLTAVLSYPTSVFIGRDGKVRKIHSGFAGPGTGEHHDHLIAELEGLIEELLGEPAA